MDYFVGLIIGAVLGLTGAGGSVFAVPLLIFLVDQSPQDAIGISLGAVAVSALFGVLTRLKSKQIQWLPAIVYAVLGGMVSPIGVYLNRQIDPELLMLSFSLLVIIVAISLWWQASTAPKNTKIVRSTISQTKDNNDAICRTNMNLPFKIGAPCILGISAGAIATGILSGLFGVGGGFLIVPTLLFLTGINIQQAIATSLVTISFISTTGFIGYISTSHHTNLALLSHVAMGGIFGMSLGVIVGRFIAGPALQKTFSILMLLLAATTVFSTFT